VVFIFSGLSVPFTPIRIPGLGVFLMKLPKRLSQASLTIAWFIYGGVLLYLPFRYHDQRGIFNAPEGATYSSFLPQNCVDWVEKLWIVQWLAKFLTPPGSYAPAWALLIISLLAVVALGFILSMSWLSWYFAVSLAFEGHNNEVGGAARIEKFKHIVRIRIRENDLTAYVIGIDDPEVNAYDAQPKLIDVFTLKVT